MFIRVVVVVALLEMVVGANQIITVESDTQLLAMNKTCASAPVTNFNLCNNTCLECTSSSSYKCSSCNQQFTHDNNECTIDNNIHSFTYYSYLNALDAELMIRDIKKFVYVDTGVNLNANKVLEICKQNTYQFFMAGPFKDTNVIGINYDFTDPIDQIQIKFNFMSLVQDVTLFIEINDVVAYTNKFIIFSDLQGTYGKNSNNAGPNYLILDATITSTNVGSLVTPVDMGVFKLISNSIRIKIGISTKSPGYCWGFSDFVVIKRACETCPTKAVEEMLTNLGQLCYIVAAVVIALILILVVMIKLERLKRKLDMEEELGSSNSLPLKAIDRVIDALQRTTKTMQKEFKKEDRKFEKTFKAILKRE